MLYTWVDVKIDPFLGTLHIRCRIIIGIRKGTIILTTTHTYVYCWLKASGFTVESSLGSLSRMTQGLHGRGD